MGERPTAVSSDDYVTRHDPEAYGRPGQRHAPDEDNRSDGAISQRRRDIDSLRRGEGRYARLVPDTPSDLPDYASDTADPGRSALRQELDDEDEEDELEADISAVLAATAPS